MIAYVLFGGMIATTWVQIVKAVLLLGGATLLALLVLAQFGMNPPALFAAAAEKYGAGGARARQAGREPARRDLARARADVRHRRAAAHPDALLHRARRAARRGRRCSTRPGFIGLFYLMTFILGFGAMVLVGPDAITAVDKGGNMAAPLLAELLGGTAVPRLHRRGRVRDDPRGRRRAHALGRRGAVARSLGRTWCARATRRRASSCGSRASRPIALGVLAIVLGITFKGQNVAFMVGLAFAIAASANFPALVLSIFWRRFTTWGAVASMVVGTFVTLVLIALSPMIQIDILHHDAAFFPLKNPAIVTIPVSFLIGIVVSLLTRDDRASHGFDEMVSAMTSGSRAH